MTLKKSIVATKLTAGEKAKLDLVCFNSGMSKSEAIRALVSQLSNNTILEQNG
tara:strand:- start:36 stop:194 length:159 start_codon:yes stop_codon:yes gene_type:complete